MGRRTQSAQVFCVTKSYLTGSGFGSYLDRPVGPILVGDLVHRPNLAVSHVRNAGNQDRRDQDESPRESVKRMGRNGCSRPPGAMRKTWRNVRKHRTSAGAAPVVTVVSFTRPHHLRQ